jgi:hypothetical protein
VLAMATTARENAQGIAFNEVGRQAIMQDPEWHGGDYAKGAGPRVGLAIARMMAHITYLSDASMDRKFGRRKAGATEGMAAGLDAQFEVENYLRHQGEVFINRFDANSYLYITRAIDHFDLPGAYGSLERAFAAVQAESLVLGFTSDWLFPPEQNRDIALALLRAGKRATYAQLDTDLGHDSFLLDSPQLYDLVRDFLEEEATSQRDRVLRQYLKPDLLIIDDMGLKALPKHSGEYLMEIIVRRHETRSTIMTSNRPLEDWGKLLQDVPTASAILDRFLHHAHLITITGKSYRLKDSALTKGKTADATPSS